MLKPITPLRDNGTRAKVASIFMLGMSIVNLLVGFALIYIAAQYRDIVDGGAFSIMLRMDEVNRYDALNPALILLRFGWWLGTGITFIMWLHRAYLNFKRFCEGKIHHGVWQTTWGWFIPIGSLWLPYQPASEMNDVGGKYLKSQVPEAYKASGAGPALNRLTGWWWGLWLAGYIISNGVAYDSRSEDLDALIGEVYRNGIAALIMVGPAIVAWLFIRRSHRVEQALYNHWQSGEYDELRQARHAAKELKDAPVQGVGSDAKPANWYKEGEDGSTVEGGSDPFQQP